MMCPWCGETVSRRSGETMEEFRERWETADCDAKPEWGT